MAQKVNIVLVDDIDASEADETVAFGIDGKEYLIDLNTKHASQLRDALSLYVGHARSASGKRASTGRRSAGTRAASNDAGEIREWARSNGYDVSERGRISSEIRDAYSAAH